MDFRQDIRIDGCPTKWETNLLDEDFHKLFFALQEELSKWGREPQNSFHFKTIEFKDGACSCFGIGSQCLAAIYCEGRDWQSWTPKCLLINNANSPQVNNDKRDVFLFCSCDDFLKAKTAKRLSRGSWEAACAFAAQRKLLRIQLPSHLRTALFAENRWDISADTISTWLRIQDAKAVINALKTYEYDTEDFEKYWEAYSLRRFEDIETSLNLKGELDWRAKVCKDPRFEELLSNVKQIQDAALEHFPDDGLLLKRVALYWEHESRIEEAIAYCQRGIDRSLDDGTSKGFTGRMKRLKNTLRKLNVPKHSNRMLTAEERKSFGSASDYRQAQKFCAPLGLDFNAPQMNWTPEKVKRNEYLLAKLRLAHPAAWTKLDAMSPEEEKEFLRDILRRA